MICNNLLDNFVAAKKDLFHDLSDLLVYKQRAGAVYKKVFTFEKTYEICYLFIQINTQKIVKVHIKLETYDNCISYLIEDEEIRNKILELDSFKKLTQTAEDCRNDYQLNRVFNNLKYDIHKKSSR